MTTETKLIKSPIQIAIIKHSLQEIGSRVTERLMSLNLENQVVTEETVSALKKMRAELNGEAKNFEEERKNIKKVILTPYEQFEEVYKSEIIEKYTKADEMLKSKISDFEMKIKVEKRNNLQAYFNELITHEGIEWLTFDRWNVEIGLSTTEKKYKETLLEFVGKIVEDLDLIKTEEHEAEILVEYKNTLNASQSITKIRQRKEQERIERERIILQRTNSRIAQLQKICFVYSDVANAYYLVQDDKISISMKDIETLENEEWNKRFAQLELESAKHTVGAGLAPAQILTPPTVGAGLAPVLTAPTVLSALEKEEKAPEEIHQAKFCVQGTMSQLMKLKEFLVSNNYNYQNI